MWLVGAAGADGARAQSSASEVDRALADWVEAHRGDAVTLLEDLTNINSDTLNGTGVKAVADVLAPRFAALGFEVRWIDGSAFGRGVLRAVTESRTNAPPPGVLRRGARAFYLHQLQETPSRTRSQR